MENKKPWEGTNFYVNIISLLLGGYIGFNQAMAEDLVGAVFGVIAAGFSIRNLVKTGKYDWKKWFSDSNFYAYLSAIITAIWPMLPGELFSSFEELMQNLLSGNWQAAVIAGVYFINVLWKLVFKPAATALLNRNK